MEHYQAFLRSLYLHNFFSSIYSQPLVQMRTTAISCLAYIVGNENKILVSGFVATQPHKIDL